MWYSKRPVSQVPSAASTARVCPHGVLRCRRRSGVRPESTATCSTAAGVAVTAWRPLPPEGFGAAVVVVAVHPVDEHTVWTLEATSSSLVGQLVGQTRIRRILPVHDSQKYALTSGFVLVGRGGFEPP